MANTYIYSFIPYHHKLASLSIIQYRIDIYMILYEILCDTYMIYKKPTPLIFSATTSCTFSKTLTGTPEIIFSHYFLSGYQSIINNVQKYIIHVNLCTFNIYLV